MSLISTAHAVHDALPCEPDAATDAALREPGLLRSQALPSPRELRQAHPLQSAHGWHTLTRTRQDIRELLHGQDDRLLLVIGPCSIHDPQAALQYAARLLRLREAHRGELVIVMRTYFEKPRSTVGWKGLVLDPRLDGSGLVSEGLHTARALLVELLRMGMPAATEFLDPLGAAYVADLIAWGAIGARTTESQTHREMASGLGLPIGFKNGTDGQVGLALDAITAARQPHQRLGINLDGQVARLSTRGNPDGHLILRGGRTPNYQAGPVADAAQALADRQLPARLVVDCSHGNSQKQHARQLDVAADLARRIASGDPHVMGVMVESHLRAGSQRLEPGHTPVASLTFGQSITDGCLGWDDSEALVEQLAWAVKRRRTA